MNEKNQTNDLHSLSHTKWSCKYHVVFAPKYRRHINVNLKMYKFAHLRMYNFIISQNLHNNL